MSKTADLNIDRLATLARLALSPAEKERFAAQLGDVLSHIEKLNTIDVTGVEPMAHAFPVTNVWRNDEATPGLSVEETLRNAPARRGDQFSVPRVVE